MASGKDDSRSSIAKDAHGPEHIKSRLSQKTPRERQVALKAALDVDPQES